MSGLLCIRCSRRWRWGRAVRWPPASSLRSRQRLELGRLRLRARCGRHRRRCCRRRWLCRNRRLLCCRYGRALRLRGLHTWNNAIAPCLFLWNRRRRKRGCFRPLHRCTLRWRVADMTPTVLCAARGRALRRVVLAVIARGPCRRIELRRAPVRAIVHALLCTGARVPFRRRHLLPSTVRLRAVVDHGRADLPWPKATHADTPRVTSTADSRCTLGTVTPCWAPPVSSSPLWQDAHCKSTPRGLAKQAASNPRRDETSPCGRPPGDGEFYLAAAPLALVRSPITATGNVRTGTASLALPYSGRAVSRHSHVFPLMKMDFSGCLENPGKTDRVPTDLLVPVTIQLYQDFVLQPFRPIHASQRYVQVNRGLFVPFHSSRGLSSLISTLPCSCIGLAIYALDVTFCLTARTRSKR